MQLLKRPKTPTPVTNLLICAIIAVFIVEILWQYLYGAEDLKTAFGMLGFSLNALLAGRWWTFVTAPFLHSGPEHIIFNALALFFFGNAVEAELGAKKTVILFFGAAVAGNLAVLGATIMGIMPADVPTVGASAAIFGLMGAAMLVKPFEFIFYPYIIPIPLVLIALIYTVFNIAEFISVLVTHAETNIAYVAHLGGLAVGMLTGFKIEGARRGFLVLLLIFALLLIIPLIWSLLSGLEIFNWVAILSRVFGV
ncbi:MAG: rhomboid family intramembrane serine protease [Candidatus Aenigmatarchaeota archaeon]